MEERNIIGIELHDSLAQSLIGMRLQLKMLERGSARKGPWRRPVRGKGLRRAMTQANADLRDLLTNYRLKIDDSGLVHTIANLVERFGRETGIAVFFQNDCRALALTPAQEIQVFFIIQEALTNIRKHSKATQRAHHAQQRRRSLHGADRRRRPRHGRRPTSMPASMRGSRSCAERTARLPGQIVIESEPGEGTRIVVIFNAPTFEAVEGLAMRVLLIDDHALVRKGIEELLQSRGVQVVASVSSGEEGVARAARACLPT